MSSIFNDNKNKLLKEVESLKKELIELKQEKKELLFKYNELKKRYISLSENFNLLLCEVRENKNDNNRGK